jgi:DNA-binding CsgD family transcriptional regulator
LLLAQGRKTEARDALGAALATSQGPDRRLRLLGPFVETLIAAGDLGPARTHAEELTERAARIGAPILEATALDATGRLLLAECKPQAARSILREALTIWQRLACPYHAARTRRVLGEAQLALDEIAPAQVDIAAAQEVFTRLGADPDAVLAAALLAREPGSGGLTAREIEVLARVAAGETNRQIAAALKISKHTVARHRSNIFDKTGTGNRTEASIHAQKSGLV